MSKEEKKFLQLIYDNQAILHKICFVYARSHTERKDLEQEITLQLWKSFSTFKGNSAFSTWMYSVALNTAISMTKKPGLFFLNDDDNTLYHELDEQNNMSEDIKILYKAIHHLKKLDKAIILMWLDEKSYDEISETTGITVKNVSVRIVRIKSKLSDIIKKIQ